MNDFGERRKPWNADPTPQETANRDTPSKNFGTSMNAISFGFVATAILIAMFLIMAIFEHILRMRSPFVHSQSDVQVSLELGPQRDQMRSVGKLGSSISVTSQGPSGFSVLMPGQQYPTYIAQPAPLPCQREGIHWASHEHHHSDPP